MAHCESSGRVKNVCHVTLKGQGHDPNMSASIILKRARDADLVIMEHIQEMSSCGMNYEMVMWPMTSHVPQKSSA